MSYFAVIDTETNWEDRVMSIGTVIADCDTFRPVSAKYHVLTPEYEVGGMYENVLFPNGRLRPILCTRQQAMADLTEWLKIYKVTGMFAYNASFDQKHLSELGWLRWYDIIRIAAYRQYNPRIPRTADCCGTGRLKRNYGVQPMYRLLSGDGSYCETHNAMYDALDELEIMRLLGYPPSRYIPLK